MSGEKIIEGAKEALRMTKRGHYFCTDCELDTLVNDDIRCVACGSGRVMRSAPKEDEVTGAAI